MKKRTITIIGLALCSNAAWAITCHSNIPKRMPDKDFEPHADGTVTHKTTGLMWKVCSEGYEYKAGSCVAIAGGTEKYTWAEALNHVSEVNKKGGFADYQDWRLPYIKELDSIVEKACYDPAINPTIFPNTPNEGFWSASPNVSNNSNAWMVHFGAGFDLSKFSKSNTYHVRLVRGK